jgi:hypothetical protein
MYAHSNLASGDHADFAIFATVIDFQLVWR